MRLSEVGIRKCTQHHSRILRSKLDAFAPCFEEFYYIVEPNRVQPEKHEMVGLSVRFKGKPYFLSGDFTAVFSQIRDLLGLGEPETPFSKMARLVQEILCQEKN